MSTVGSEALLNSLYDDNATLGDAAVGYMALNSDGNDILVDTSEHVTITTSRQIQIPESVRRVAVQYDNNANKVTFDCPRYWDALDLSTLNIHVKYVRPDGEAGSVDAQNIVVGEANDSLIHFEWVVKEHATQVAGALKIQICATNGKNHWNSEVCSDVYVSEGIPCVVEG